MQQAVFRTVEELEAAVGKPVAQSDWLAITQRLVDDFAHLTNDTQWIHVDPDRARVESPFGTTIAHGFLIVSLLVPMISECITLPPARLAINYGFDRLRFIAPVPVGSEIRGNFGVESVTRSSSGVTIAWNTEVAVRDSPRPSVAAVWLGRFLFE